MRKFSRYQKNLKVEGNRVISYTTKVARIEGQYLIELGHWSQTTTKHVNYAAKELGLTVVRHDQELPEGVEKDQNVDSELGGVLKLAGVFGAMMDLTTDPNNEESRIDTLEGKKRILRATPGISLPDDFDQLPIEEQEKRVNKALEFARGQ